MSRYCAEAPQAATPDIDKEHAMEICRVGSWMYERQFVVACEGNLSVRLDPEQILITPTGACKGHLAPGDLVITDLSGRVTRGTRRPSSEILMHLLYYRLRPDVRAVCHAHPPTATGFAAAGRALEETVLPEIIVGLGKIPLARYGTPGTWDLCVGLEPLVLRHDAILLENHGVVTCGEDLTSAYHRMETVEQFARVTLTAELLGGPHVLPHAEVQKLVAASPRHGLPCRRDRVEAPLSPESAGDRGRTARAKLAPLLEENVRGDRPQ
jgi:L-fuculose-phosphate aldolase